MRRFPPLDPAARRVLAFNFTADLAPGDTLSGATVTAALQAGSDETPAQIIVGLPAIDGARVLQLATGRADDNAYTLKCIASTTAGEVLTLTAVITMQEGA